MIHAPVHASWLNQVEIVFSVIQKKVLTPNDFAGTGTLSQTLLAFTDRYNLTARPPSYRTRSQTGTSVLASVLNDGSGSGTTTTVMPVGPLWYLMSCLDCGKNATRNLKLRA
jgi:hypothetical protein